MKGADGDTRLLCLPKPLTKSTLIHVKERCEKGDSPNDTREGRNDREAAFELVTKTRTNEKVVRESGGEQLLKGYRGEIAQRLMNTASVVEQQVFRNRI